MHIDLLSRLNGLANHGAGWVMWLLIALSIAGLGVILERAVALGAARDNLPRLRDDLLAAAGGSDAALARAGRSRAFEARVLVAAAQAGGGPGGVEAAEQRLTGAVQLARIEMERGLAFLGTVGNNAPFIGLLGTVIGIIRSFHALDTSAGKVSAGLMVEVGEALIATAVGILVALPAIASFNLFQRVIKTRLGRAEALGRDLLGALAQRAAAGAAAPAERS
jgi:biopolymer transport protein ExbB